MEDCTCCGKEDADAVCEGCGDIFCKDCIKEGMCPVCGGFGQHEDEDFAEEVT